METLTGYRINVRYDLAKKKLDENFLRWLSIPTTTHLIQKLIDECKSPNFSLTHPPPTFQTRLSTPASPTINSPKRSSLTPPLSPSAHEKFVSTHAVSLPPEVLNSSPSKTQPMPALIASIKPIIPQFYFPKGRPAEREIEEKNNQLINEVFRSDMMSVDEFHLITTTVCGLPKTLTSKLFDLIGGSHSISKPQFVRFWKSELENKSVAQRFFTVLKKPDKNYIERDDLKPIMKIIMETHPGLEFLKATPEFQERYADTVIERIFFTVDLNDDGKITIRELKKSNLVQVFLILDEEEDINKIRDYFSYEHFYVLYCRFWELDNDHDFIIDKEDFARYEGHSLSRKAIDRIFEGHARKFKCTMAGKMSYDDFTCKI
jgi:serine/threonine-protein phosphatase 2A regulatory subunit B''